MNYKIPLSKPDLTRADFLEIKKAFDSTWISSKSPWIERFEKLFAQKVSHTKYAIALNSGTSALFLALKSLGIGPGDEVILPTFTMIATINAVVWSGATPVLVDCQSRVDWNMNVTEVEKKITKKTKAIIPVHVYGYVCDMNTIVKTAKKYKLKVIEDAAEAMGSTYADKNAGSFGDLSCFSLYSNKIITTGNGGVVATNNLALHTLIKQLSFFDFNPRHHFLHYKIGYNLVLSGLQAALGVSQVKRFPSLLEKRRTIFYWYGEFLKNNNEIIFISPQKKQAPNYWFPAIIFRNQKTKLFVERKLKAKRIETRNFFIPLHKQPAYGGLFKRLAFPLAEYFSSGGMLLPSYFDLTKAGVQSICEIINR